MRISVEELAGEAYPGRVGEVIDATEQMSVARLAQEALLLPLEKLASIRPKEQLRIIVDSPDDGLDITKAIPFGTELPDNVTWILTTQPGEHLDRLVSQGDATQVGRLDLSEPDITDASIDEAAAYALTRLNEPSFRCVTRRGSGRTVKRRALTTLATDVVLSLEPETGSDTFVDALSAWLTLRAKEQLASDGSELHGDCYLRKMADWAIANSS